MKIRETTYGGSYKNPEVIAQVEKEYPQTTAEFWRICHEQYETFCSKQSNYGPSNISVGTALSTPDEIKLSLVGLWFRMNDKISRLKQMVVLGAKDNVGESIADTYQDLSVYGIIAQMVQRGVWGK